MFNKRIIFVAITILSCSLHVQGASKYYTDENRPYEFGFTIDGEQHRHEKKDENGLIMGEFGFITADGVYHVTVYATDENGNFKILSMKNLRVKPYPTARERKGNSLPFPPSSSQAGPVAQAPSLKTPAPIASPVKSCSHCSIPTTTKAPSLTDLAVVSGDPQYSNPHYPNNPQYPQNPQLPQFPANQQYPQSQKNLPNSDYPTNQQYPQNTQYPENQSSHNSQYPENQLYPHNAQYPQNKQYPQNRQYSESPQNPESTQYPMGAINKPGDNNQGSGQNLQPGERNPKQINDLSQYPQDGSVLNKPTLISAQMQIVDKNTDIHHLGPGEKEGLPSGLNKGDMKLLLYTFNYTVGFHGHHEEGYTDGTKVGYYFVTGRNGVRTKVDYIADENGFRPKISQEILDIISDDVPKEETEKDPKFGLKGYEFKWIYYPVESRR